MIYLKLFWVFFKMGAFIFGAGHALVSAMQEEIVGMGEGKLSAEEFQDGWSAGNLLPGPIATKMAVYVGYKVGGILGAICSLIGYLLPSVIPMLLLSFFIIKFKDNKIIHSALKGIKPAVMALIAVAVVEFIKAKSVSDIRGILIAIATFVLLLLNVSPVLVTIGAGVLGLTYLLF